MKKYLQIGILLASFALFVGGMCYFTDASWADAVNGTYELSGGIFLIQNCVRLYKDKEVKGISILSAAFFTSWGYWNLYYYPSLNQWVSFFGGLLIVISNTWWVIMAMYYAKKKRKMGS